MITCMPRRMWIVALRSQSSRITAVTGEPMIATAALYSAPMSMTTMTMAAISSGISAIEVTRESQKCSVPLRAAPSPRTLPSGVFISGPVIGSPRQEDRDPQQDRERDRAGERAVGQPVAPGRVHAAARVPDQVADAAERVMEERPGEAEQEQEPDRRTHEGLGAQEGVR